jgi:hypothetical protein
MQPAAEVMPFVKLVVIRLPATKLTLRMLVGMAAEAVMPVEMAVVVVI